MAGRRLPKYDATVGEVKLQRDEIIAKLKRHDGDFTSQSRAYLQGVLDTLNMTIRILEGQRVKVK